MTLGERKAAANKRRRAFHIYTMSALTALSWAYSQLSRSRA